MRTPSRVCSALLTAGLIGSLLSVGGAAVAAPLPPARPSIDAPPADVSRGLIVKTTGDEPTQAVQQATEKALDGAAEVVSGDALVDDLGTVTFDEPVSEEVAAAAAREVQERKDVEWAVPDTLRRTQAPSPETTDDPLFRFQRNLWDTVITSPVGGYSIKAPTAWRLTRGNPDVTVAVIDTGVVDHPDLEGQTVRGYDFVDEDIPGVFETANDGDGRDADPTDPGDWVPKGACYRNSPAELSSWHGTFVAGEIAAKADNQAFVAGVAPGVKVQPLRVLGTCGGYDSDILAGIAYAAGEPVTGAGRDTVQEDAADVINLSLGSTYETVTEARSACVAYNDVFARAADKGITTVVAAGNDGVPATTAVPAACNDVLSVGATSHKGYGAIYSNYGSGVDISAVGGDSTVEGGSDTIVGLVSSSIQDYDPDDGFKHARYEGTSMAAPEVAAGAALIHSILLDRGITPRRDDVRKELMLARQGFGTSTAYKAKKVTVDGETFTVDLSCKGTYSCGAGIFDLSKLAVAKTPPTISGAAVVGEQLTMKPGPWLNAAVQPTYTWTLDDSARTVLSGCDTTCWVPQSAAGHRISVTMTPRGGASALVSTSEPTAVVPAGPQVSVTGVPTKATYGDVVTVEATVGTAETGLVGPGAQVELRSSSMAEPLASALTDANGVATFELPGSTWTRSYADVRAAFVGDDTHPAASSPHSSVTLVKSPSTLSATMSSVVSSKSKLSVKVAVSSKVPVPLTGLVVIKASGKTMAVYSLKPADQGRKAFSLAKMSKGKKTMTVEYRGDGNRLAAKTVKKTVTVK